MVLGVIEFRLDQRSGVPTYLQLVQQVKQALRLGILQPGDQLPTVKEVVGKLAINPNTVLKAYRELDHEGVTEGRRGQGTFVSHDQQAAGPCVCSDRRRANGPTSCCRASASSRRSIRFTGASASATCSRPARSSIQAGTVRSR